MRTSLFFYAMMSENIMSAPIVKTSKFLSYILRHNPGQIGLTLDPHGWVEVEMLLRCAAAHGRPLSRELLAEVVAHNDKQRFSFSPDGRLIRANQGHSLPVDLQLTPSEPPAVLFHGTADRFWPAIQVEGLLPRKLHHVHLSVDIETARQVGRRHGRPLILRVAADEMGAAGHLFYRSENGVWLTEHVPPRFLALFGPPEA